MEGRKDKGVDQKERRERKTADRQVLFPAGLGTFERSGKRFSHTHLGVWVLASFFVAWFGLAWLPVLCEKLSWTIMRVGKREKEFEYAQSV